ncbi:MAG: VOC family protein [Burkholderiales bacterium]
MTTGIRKTGEFCWFNMLTPQPAKAREFFASLLRWTYVALPAGMGHRIQVGGRDVGGLFDLDNPQTPKGTPPHIGVMVKVDSADTTAARVASLGGRAMPAFDILDQGRMAVCFDPNGAAFDVWQAKKGQGTDADTTLHGAPSWFESMTTDVDRASQFYAALFGWTAEPMPMGAFTYTTFKLGDAYVAGMMAITPDMGAMAPHWSVYFTVDDADGIARDATALGATIVVPPQDVPNVGRFVGITSPQGVTFFVMKYAG